MIEKRVYTNEVIIKFNVFTSDNKNVDRAIEKVVKLLNKNNIGVDVHLNRTFEGYPELPTE